MSPVWFKDRWDSPWRPVSDPVSSFRPAVESVGSTPTDMFSTWSCGRQVGRSWPIAPSPEVLVRRWEMLFAGGSADPELFVERPRRSVSMQVRDAGPALDRLEAAATMATPTRYAYRPFDHQWVLPDPRLCAYIRPELRSAPDRAFAVFSRPQRRLRGPALWVTTHVPDLEAASGSYGGKDVALVDLSDPEARDALVSVLGRWGHPQAPPGPVSMDGPVTSVERRRGEVLLRAQLDWSNGVATPGAARELEAISCVPSGSDVSWSNGVLRVGDGAVGPVSRAAWDYQVAGWPVVSRWIAARSERGRGRTSSQLDLIRPAWTFTDELLGLLSVLEECAQSHA